MNKTPSKIIDNTKFQVFLMSCPAHLPFFFARHSWLVVNRKGKISRWEVLFRRRKNSTNWGHLHLNALAPFKAIPIVPFSDRFFWKSRLVGYIEGEAGSLAEKMGETIESSATTYPHAAKYSLLNPNSNTYVKWILDKFPDSGLRLEWNAF